jgi:hypothetical protein
MKLMDYMQQKYTYSRWEYICTAHMMRSKEQIDLQPDNPKSKAKTS